VKSYATRLGLLYPLGSPIDLDEEFNPLHPDRYYSIGNEGRWYVAGWNGKDGLNLHRDSREALCGEWTLRAPLQSVMGSPAWRLFQLQDQQRGLGRNTGPGGTEIALYKRPEAGEVPNPGEIVAYLERESWGSGEYDDSYDLLHKTLAELREENPGAGILRREWAISLYALPSSSPYWRLVQAWSARRRGDWGQRDAVLWVRYIRRGVREPWELFDIVRDEDQALKQIDREAIPLSPRLELLRQIDREVWDQDQIKKEQEEKEKREASERWEKRGRGDKCFRRLWEGAGEGRELARKWNATMAYMNQPEMRGALERLHGDADFLALYVRCLEAEKVGTKKKLMKEVLREMRKRERVNVEAESDGETS